MPHYIQDGIRSLADYCVIKTPTRKEYPIGAYIIELVDVIAGCTFLLGSCCFLPRYAEDVRTFLWGCVLFIVGSTLYVGVCVFCLAEALVEKGSDSFEFWENVLYVFGGVVFLIGSFLYMPDAEEKCFLKDGSSTCSSISQEVNKNDREFFGSTLFIVGSCIFAMAAFVNAMGQRRHDSWTANMLALITSFYLGGSMLYAMGSMCFLPDLGCDDRMLAVGAWMFISGSIMFVIGSLLSLWRTAHIYSTVGDNEAEAEKGLMHSQESRSSRLDDANEK